MCRTLGGLEKVNEEIRTIIYPYKEQHNAKSI